MSIFKVSMSICPWKIRTWTCIHAIHAKYSINPETSHNWLFFFWRNVMSRFQCHGPWLMAHRTIYLFFYLFGFKVCRLDRPYQISCFVKFSQVVKIWNRRRPSTQHRSTVNMNILKVCYTDELFCFCWTERLKSELLHENIRWYPSTGYRTG